MMNAMRLNNGVPKQFFSGRTGIALKKIEPVIDKLLRLDLIELPTINLAPTPRGRQFLNNLLETFNK